MASKQVNSEAPATEAASLRDTLFKEYAPIIALAEGNYFIATKMRAFWMPSNSEFATNGRIPAMEFEALEGVVEMNGDVTDLVAGQTYAFAITGVGLLNQLKQAHIKPVEVFGIRYIKKVLRADNTNVKKYRVEVNRTADDVDDPFATDSSVTDA